MARKLFFHMVFRKFIENANKKKILVSTMFFTNINIFFLICVVISFQSLPKKVNQIRNNVVKRNGVSGPIFPDYVISCDYGLYTN